MLKVHDVVGPSMILDAPRREKSPTQNVITKKNLREINHLQNVITKINSKREKSPTSDIIMRL